MSDRHHVRRFIDRLFEDDTDLDTQEIFRQASAWQESVDTMFEMSVLPPSAVKDNILRQLTDDNHDLLGGRLNHILRLADFLNLKQLVHEINTLELPLAFNHYRQDLQDMFGRELALYKLRIGGGAINP